MTKIWWFQNYVIFKLTIMTMSYLNSHGKVFQTQSDGVTVKDNENIYRCNTLCDFFTGFKTILEFSAASIEEFVQY